MTSDAEKRLLDALDRHAREPARPAFEAELRERFVSGGGGAVRRGTPRRAGGPRVLPRRVGRATWMVVVGGIASAAACVTLALVWFGGDAGTSISGAGGPGGAVTSADAPDGVPTTGAADRLHPGQETPGGDLSDAGAVSDVEGRPGAGDAGGGDLAAAPSTSGHGGCPPGMIDGIHWRASTRASAGVDASLLDDLLAGRPVRSGDVAVDLTDGAGIELHLRPNTTLHASQDEDVLRLTVDDGEVLVDASSDARHITVTTPCATVDVNVATVGVMVGTDGTCVCIADGRVVAERLGSGERMPVDARQSWIAYADPAVPVLLSAFEGPGGLPDDYEREHLAPLRRFRADLAR